MGEVFFTNREIFVILGIFSSIGAGGASIDCLFSSALNTTLKLSLAMTERSVASFPQKRNSNTPLITCHLLVIPARYLRNGYEITNEYRYIRRAVASLAKIHAVCISAGTSLLLSRIGRLCFPDCASALRLMCSVRRHFLVGFRNLNSGKTKPPAY